MNTYTFTAHNNNSIFNGTDYSKILDNIIATDIDSTILAKAKNGEYAETEMKNVTDEDRNIDFLPCRTYTIYHSDP